MNHRKRIEDCDTIVLIAPIWNFRMPAIVEGMDRQSFSTTLGVYDLSNYGETMDIQLVIYIKKKQLYFALMDLQG